MTEENPQAASRPFANRFHIFVVLWSLASCFQAWHQLAWPIVGGPGLAAGATVILAVLAIGRPSSTGSFALLAAWQVGWAIYQMPDISDQRFLALLVDLSIVLSYAMAVMVRSKRGVTVDDVYVGFAACARWILLIYLFFSALSKYNSGFVDLTQSCAVSHWQSLARQWIPALANAKWTYSVVVAGVIIVETVVLLGLLITPLRAFSVGVGSLFYSVVGFCGICYGPDMAFTMYALLFLMTSHKVADSLFFSEASTQLKVPVYGVIAALTAIIAVGAAAMAMQTKDVEQMQRFYGWLQSLSTLAAGVVWCALLLWGLAKCPRAGFLGSASFFVGNPILYFVLLVALLSGISPYVGWKTRMAFTQYSNLCTENNKTNHYFVPQRYLGDYQTKLIRVVDSSDESLKSLSAGDLFVPKFELIRLTSKRPEASLEYELIGGGLLKVKEVKEAKDLMDPPAWWQVKFLSFRPYSPDGCRCLR